MLLPKMISQMVTEYKTKHENVLIGTGPSICGCCYNVSKDLYIKFSHESDEGSIRECSYYLDLKQINKNQALKSGISINNIEIMNYCTACSNKQFYSYGKEGEPSRRFSFYMKITS